MKSSLLIRTLLLVLIAASASAATLLPKKVVFTSAGIGLWSFSESEIAEMRKAAPTLDLVFVTDRSKLAAELADADGVIGGLNADLLKAAPKLRWMQVTSAGVENYMYPEARERPFTMTNMKIVQGVEIADHAFALLLGLARHIDTAMIAKTTETWNPQSFRPLLELRGKTCVIVGVGGIGNQIAIRAKAFGMTVIGVDPNDIPLTPQLDRTVWPDRLDTVLPEADVLFISAPHTPQTEKMIKAQQFALLKKGAIFIAVSRGKIYDANALVDALKSGHLAGAGLDVHDPEPLPKGHPLWKMDRVIITPHIAGRSDGEGARYFEILKENLARFAHGEPLRNTVDKQRGY